MKEEYIRPAAVVAEFDVEDVIITSGGYSDSDGIRQRTNPVYTNGTNDGNWLTWLQ